LNAGALRGSFTGADNCQRWGHTTMTRTGVPVLLASTLVASTLVASALAPLVGVPPPAHADEGDPAGWFLRVDPRQRAFLTFTAQAEGPRLLMFGCLRDAGTFTTMSAAVGEREEVPKARLRLSGEAASFEAEGEIAPYPSDGRSSFISDLDVDEAAMKAIGPRLLAALRGTGDMTLEIGPQGASPTARAVIPRAGLAEVLPRFAKVCFR
jgi:hypothetical protein